MSFLLNLEYPKIHPNYAFHVFSAITIFGLDFLGQKNHIKGEFRDILDSQKNPIIRPSFHFRDFCPKMAN